MRLVIALLLAATLAACASTGRAMSYGNRFADARYETAGKSFAVWVHPSENVVMIQGDTGSAITAGLVEGATFGAGRVSPQFERWRAGAEAFVSPIGCEVQNLRPLDQDIMWEFDYVCPEGVDLRALVAAQRQALRDGTPLHR